MAALKRAPTFTQWLRYYRPGRVAAWALADSCWPKMARTLTTFIQHTAGHHGSPPSELELRSCFAKYRVFLRSGGTVPSQAGLKRDKRIVLHYVSISKEAAACLTALQAAADQPGRSIAIERALIAHHHLLFGGTYCDQ